MKICMALLTTLAVSIATAAWAGEVDVTDVKVHKTGNDTYRFDVTLKYADTG